MLVGEMLQEADVPAASAALVLPRYRRKAAVGSEGEGVWGEEVHGGILIAPNHEPQN